MPETLEDRLRLAYENGWYIFEIVASYAKQGPFHPWYVLQTGKKKARERFLKTYSWLDVITSVEKLDINTAIERLCSKDSTSIVL